jgi:hypothetical protein
MITNFINSFFTNNLCWDEAKQKLHGCRKDYCDWNMVVLHHPFAIVQCVLTFLVFSVSTHCAVCVSTSAVTYLSCHMVLFMQYCVHRWSCENLCWLSLHTVQGWLMVMLILTFVVMSPWCSVYKLTIHTVQREHCVEMVDGAVST